MQDLIRKNKEIQKDCDEIDTKVLKGKKFSNIILEKLDAILNPKIPDVQDKFDLKNKLLGKCDELYDDCESGLTNYENKIIEKEKAI